ncbi:uncharacterized protein LOC132486711 [Mesoplodon densirostris]|uniref:uncharacterized protein LOC132486711 n=1 Tax=Mesoplodon densirostris TaxID=48708 RepID=UPI0028DAFA44|nr:uncharacterized protein LOC132486711 [Mesoplodon densirostris]
MKQQVVELERLSDLGWGLHWPYSQAFRLGLNYTTGFLGSPACKGQVMKPAALLNCPPGKELKTPQGSSQGGTEALTSNVPFFPIPFTSPDTRTAKTGSAVHVAPQGWVLGLERTHLQTAISIAHVHMESSISPSSPPLCLFPSPRVSESALEEEGAQGWKRSPGSVRLSSGPTRPSPRPPPSRLGRARGVSLASPFALASLAFDHPELQRRAAWGGVIRPGTHVSVPGAGSAEAAEGFPPRPQCRPAVAAPPAGFAPGPPHPPSRERPSAPPHLPPRSSSLQIPPPRPIPSAAPLLPPPPVSLAPARGHPPPPSGPARTRRGIRHLLPQSRARGSAEQPPPPPPQPGPLRASPSRPSAPGAPGPRPHHSPAPLPSLLPPSPLLSPFACSPSRAR